VVTAKGFGFFRRAETKSPFVTETSNSSIELIQAISIRRIEFLSTGLRIVGLLDTTLWKRGECVVFVTSALLGGGKGLCKVDGDEIGEVAVADKYDCSRSVNLFLR